MTNFHRKRYHRLTKFEKLVIRAIRNKLHALQEAWQRDSDTDIPSYDYNNYYKPRQELLEKWHDIEYPGGPRYIWQMYVNWCDDENEMEWRKQVHQEYLDSLKH